MIESERLYCTIKSQTYFNDIVLKYLIPFFIFFTILLPGKIFADDVEPEYDEVMVTFNVPQVGSTEIPVIIRGTTLYLPAVDIFNFLKIKNNPTPGFESITGYLLTQEDSFNINKAQNIIKYQGKTFILSSTDFMLTETNLFLKSDYFGKVFGLECTFNLRSLTVTLNTKLDLPIIREIRQEQMRKNINKISGTIVSDTTIKRNYPFFKFGALDWAVISQQETNMKSNNRLNLTLGATIAGGETKLGINYFNYLPFSEKHQYYLWRYVNNDKKIIKQIQVGRINPQLTSTIYSPVIGLQLTNIPTTYDRSYGTYILSDQTNPNWVVELYVNDVLIDYTKADASGFFIFNIPLVYGNTSIKLRFYGPYGEETSREKNLNIPFAFTPLHTLQYSLSGGIIEDTSSSKFSRLTLNYGLSNRISVGGGFEYLSSVTTGTKMPFLNTSIRLFKDLLISSEYTYGVRSKNILSFNLRSKLRFELNYTKYKKGQKAIDYSQIEERRAIISMPIGNKHFRIYSRLSFNQMVFSSVNYTTTELLLSSIFRKFSISLNTYAVLSMPTNPYIYSNLSLSFNLPKKFIFTPQVEYRYNDNSIIFYKGTLEKRFLENNYLSISFLRNNSNKINYLQVGIRYVFPYAETGVMSAISNKSIITQQSANGSLVYNKKIKYPIFSNRNFVGKAGIVIVAFLDINCNGIHDKDEPKVTDLNVRANGGRIINNLKDSTIRILEIEPYTKYFIEIDNYSFENISWQVKNKNICIETEPNQLKIVEIPVYVYGEVSGNVYQYKYKSKKGIGRIKVNFLNEKDSSLFKTVLTEDDGYFNYLGFPPGSYIAQIDTEQLKKLELTSIPSMIPFDIISYKNGDLVYNLNFILKSIYSKDVISDEKDYPIENNTKENATNVIHAPKENVVSTKTESNNIQSKDLQQYLDNLAKLRKIAVIISDKYKTLAEAKETNSKKLIDDSKKITDAAQKQSILSKSDSLKADAIKLTIGSNKAANIAKQIEKRENATNPKIDSAFINSCTNNLIYLIIQETGVKNKKDLKEIEQVIKSLSVNISKNANTTAPSNNKITQNINTSVMDNNANNITKPNAVKPNTVTKPATETKTNNETKPENKNKPKEIVLSDSVKAENLNKFIKTTTDPATVKGLFFTVQIGVYKKPDVTKFTTITNPDFIVEKFNNQYRISSGKFYNLLDVSVHKENLNKLGFKDAYIVGYYSGKKISYKEAKKIYYNH